MPHEWEGHGWAQPGCFPIPLPPASPYSCPSQVPFHCCQHPQWRWARKKRDNAGGSDLKNPQFFRLARTTNHLEGIITY